MGIAYVAAAFVGFVPSPFGDAEPEATARYYPPETWAYATISLNPAGEQRRHLIDIFAQLQDSHAARELSDESSDAIEDYAAETFGTEYYRTDVDADQPASFFTDFQEPYQFGWVTSYGYLFASITEQAMLNAVAHLRTNGNSVYHTPQFARIYDLMPKSAMTYAFLDIQSTVKQIDPEDFGIDYDLYGALRDTLDSAAMSIEENPDHIRTRIAITLFP